MTLGESGGARSVPDSPQSSIFLPLPLGPTLLLEGTYRDFLELLYWKPGPSTITFLSYRIKLKGYLKERQG